jgi:hypothetical protein
VLHHPTPNKRVSQATNPTPIPQCTIGAHVPS